MFLKYNRELIEKLKELDRQKRFPYEDVNRIQEKYQSQVPGLSEENRLIEDFDDYQSLINGSLSYVLAGKKIPQYQKQFLNKRFFSNYPLYAFLEEELAFYPDFKRELQVYELSREILLKL